jgi:hypothetical protein
MSDDVKVETPKEKPLFHNKSAAGKGDSPRNISNKFFKNYDLINWGHKKKKEYWLQDAFDAAKKDRKNDPEWSKGHSSVKEK